MSRDGSVHRTGMTRDGVKRWMREWIEMGGRPDAFKIIRRRIGLWEEVSHGEDSRHVSEDLS